MNSSPEDNLQKALLRLPQPKAPAGFRAAALARIAAKSKPWWHLRYRDWPAAAQLGLPCAAAAFTALISRLPEPLIGELSQSTSAAPALRWIESALTALRLLIDAFHGILIRSEDIAFWSLAGFGLLCLLTGMAATASGAILRLAKPAAANS